nr:hypothetical protein HmN_000457500 [Hymenolepis microstoma]
MEIIPEPCDWREFEEKQRRLRNSVGDKDEIKSISAEVASLEQGTPISLLSDEERTTDTAVEISSQNGNESISSHGTPQTRMQLHSNEPTITLQNSPSQKNADVLITNKPIEIAFSINQLTKVQDQVKKVNSTIPTTSVTIFCPTYNVNPEGIYLATPSTFPSQSPVNSEFRMPLPIPQSYVKTAPTVHTNPPPGRSSTSLRGRRSGSSADDGRPRRKYRRQPNAKVRHSSKDLIQELPVVRPANPRTLSQSSTLRTASAMSGVKNGVSDSESDCCFRKSSSCLTNASCSLQEFSVDCPKCIAYAKEVEPLIKRLTAVEDTPNDNISIFELKRLLVEMDNRNFAAVMLKLLHAFPIEMIQHITA